MIANAAKVFKNETKKSRNGIAYCYNHSVKHERALTVLKCVGDKHLVCVSCYGLELTRSVQATSRSIM